MRRRCTLLTGLLLSCILMACNNQTTEPQPTKAPETEITASVTPTKGPEATNTPAPTEAPAVTTTPTALPTPTEPPAPTTIPLEPIAIDEAHFTSEVFRAYVLAHFDTDKDGLLSEEERQAVTRIYLDYYVDYAYDFQNETVDGLEYFPELTFFGTDFRIGTLSIENHPNLQKISFSVSWDSEEDGAYEYLSVKDCPNLKEISASVTKDITVSGCEQLELVWLMTEDSDTHEGEWKFFDNPKMTLSVNGKPYYGFKPARTGTLQLDASMVLKNSGDYADCNFDYDEFEEEEYVHGAREEGEYWIKKFDFSGQDGATLWDTVTIDWTNRNEDSFLPTEEHVVPLLKEAMEQSYQFDLRELTTEITEKDGKKGYSVVSSYLESGYHTTVVPIYTDTIPLPEHFFVRVTDVSEYFPIEYAPNLGAVVRAKFLTEFVYTENGTETVIDKKEKEVYALVKTDKSVTFYTEYSDVKGWNLSSAEEEHLFPTAEVLNAWLENYEFNTLYQFGFKKMTLGETTRDGKQGYYTTVTEAETCKEFLSNLSFPVVYADTVPDAEACTAQFGCLNSYESVHYSTGIGHVLEANIEVEFISRPKVGESAVVVRNFPFWITVAADGTFSLYPSEKSLPEQFQISSAENIY